MKKFVYTIKRNIRVNAVLYGGFFLVALVICFLHYKFSTSFSFVDEYTNYVAGYFMLKGRVLYKDIFFQHQLLPVYLSYIIQLFLHPNTLYKLIMYHRLFVLVFSLLVDLLILFRFRFVGLGYIIVYEITKFYLFGNLFLGETFVAPILAFELGLVWTTFHGEKAKIVSLRTYILSSICTWFVIFTREPLSFTALFLFILLLCGKSPLKHKVIAVITLLFLSCITVITTNIPAYLFDLVTVNIGYTQTELVSNHQTGFGQLKILLYPVFVFLTGSWNEFRGVLVFLDTVLFILLGAYIFIHRTKQLIRVVVMVGALFIVLALSSVRWVTPGNIFYNGFHSLPWYSLFVMSVFLLWQEVTKQYRNLYKNMIIIAIMLISVGIVLLSPYSYLRQPLNRDTLFTTNYARFYTVGTVVATLSNPHSTLFADGWDSLVYWQANDASAYSYIFNYPVMSNIQKFSQAKDQMFQFSPPDFYYVDCPKNVHSVVFASKEVMSNYIQLTHLGKSTCLYVKKTDAFMISQTQWQSIESLGYKK